MKLMFEFWPPQWINGLITNQNRWGKEMTPGSMFTLEDVEYFQCFRHLSLPSPIPTACRTLF